MDIHSLELGITTKNGHFVYFSSWEKPDIAGKGQM